MAVRRDFSVVITSVLYIYSMSCSLLHFVNVTVIHGYVKKTIHSIYGLVGQYVPKSKHSSIMQSDVLLGSWVPLNKW